ncbi:MAG: aminomethyltransferase beta-barrel domain-containing protein [Balneolaceae bacterium]
MTDIDAENNIITIGEKEDLVSTTCIANELNLVKYDEIPEGEMEISGKIRYNDSGALGTITQLNENECAVHFPAGREAITPGQAVVCYEGDDVVAGGWIRKIQVDMKELTGTPHSTTIV